MIVSMAIHICFLHLFSGVLLTSLVVEADHVVVVTLQPGTLGLGADWQSGRVTRIDEGGQCWQHGIMVGMQIEKIDDKPYSEKLLDRRIAGKDSYKMTFSEPSGSLEDLELKPGHKETSKFEYAKPLTEMSFREEVYMAANATKSDSSSPAYYPVVMFYMEFCPHCQKLLPEFEKAAEMVHKRIQSAGAPDNIYPKFFVFRCNRPHEPNPICKRYGQEMPVIRLFRDHRSVLFQRSRSANAIAWWALRVSRPPLLEARTSLQSRESLFVLHVDTTREPYVLNSWKEVALDFIEDYTFVYAKPGSVVSKELDAPPSVTVIGQGLDPLPFEGDMSLPNLKQWVTINQFKPVEDLNSANEYALEQCGFPVVALVYDSTVDGSEQFEAFETWARKFRPMREFIFAAADVGNAYTKEFIGEAFPLLSPRWTSLPRIFAFNGSSTYWESLPVHDASQLNIEDIRALLRDSAARQDDSMWGWSKEKGKMAWRFTFSSSTGFGTSSCVLLAFIAGCRSVMRSLIKSDEQPSDASTKVSKAD